MAETYQIRRVDHTPDWNEIPKAAISNYRWREGYTPEAYGQVVLLDKVGFLVRMSCKEENPKATYVNENDPVCKDSCLEFFANFNPSGSESGYMNCEANALGTLLCGIGPQRAGRQKLAALNIPRPEIRPFKEGEFWGYELLIPFSLLQTIYGPQEWKSGSVIMGNFYKCGDETAVEHYGMWNAVEWEKPDFHRPEQFGTLVLD